MGETAARVTIDVALTRFFEHYYGYRPVQATFTGVHDYDGCLPDWSPEGLDRLVANMESVRRLLDAAGRVDDARVRSFPEDVDLALADGFLEIQGAEHDCGHFVHRNPTLWTGEAIFGVIALVTRPFAPVEARLASTAARLRAIPTFLANARLLLAASPSAWRVRAVRECGAGVRLFRESLPRWWSKGDASRRIPDTLVADLTTAAADAAVALEKFSAWIEQQPLDDRQERTAVGSSVLTLLLRRGHWCATSIDALLAEARDALDEATTNLDRRAREIAPGGWPEVEAQLHAKHSDAEDYLSRFETTWRACREMAVAHELVTWPEAPIRYVPIPEHTRDAAPDLYYLFYRSPAPFDHLPVHDYVVPPVSEDDPPDERQRRLRAANDSAITLNHVVHHGALGHHVQNSYASRSASRIGQVAAVDGACRIGMFSAGTLAEGWACYACDLAEEAGFLTPLDAIAQQHTRVRLLVRAVADLELHSGRRTLDETASLYRERAAMRAEAAHAEAVKSSMFPGAAIMYWLGTRDLHRLRRAREAREGPAFRLRSFHDRVLSYGAIPVPLIARLMDADQL